MTSPTDAPVSHKNTWPNLKRTTKCKAIQIPIDYIAVYKQQ